MIVLGTALVQHIDVYKSYYRSSIFWELSDFFPTNSVIIDDIDCVFISSTF